MAMRQTLRVAALLLSACGLFGCSIFHRIKGRAEATSVSAPAPTQDNRRVFFFKIDRKWKEAHAQYAGDYGVIRYRDENGDRNPDLPDEVIQMTPRAYPTHLIDLSWSYTPKSGERAIRRVGEGETPEEDSAPSP